MKIIIDDEIIDSTYFTLSDVMPTLERTTLTIMNGKGTHRSWGTPSVTSTVVFNSTRLTAVHVGFTHKHRGGQGWFYYVEGERRSWAQLDETRRKLVLANLKRAPSWAHKPGKLRSETSARIKKPPMRAVKIVMLGPTGRMFSLYDASVQYTLGKRLTEVARPDHGGGYYAYPSIDALIDSLSIGGLKGMVRSHHGVAVIEVELSGRIIKYGGGKIAATHIKPVRILKEYKGSPEYQTLIMVYPAGRLFVGDYDHTGDILLPDSIATLQAEWEAGS